MQLAESIEACCKTATDGIWSAMLSDARSENSCVNDSKYPKITTSEGHSVLLYHLACLPGQGDRQKVYPWLD